MQAWANHNGKKKHSVSRYTRYREKNRANTPPQKSSNNKGRQRDRKKNKTAAKQKTINITEMCKSSLINNYIE